MAKKSSKNLKTYCDYFLTNYFDNIMYNINIYIHYIKNQLDHSKLCSFDSNLLLSIFNINCNILRYVIYYNQISTLVIEIESLN